jgi:uncharacterized membrane protein YfcA
MLIAGLVQSNIGFGLALIAAPVLVLISPDLVPGPIIAVSTLFMVSSAWKCWNKVDRSSLAWGALSRVPGTLLGGVALAYLSTSGINVLFGLLVLLAVVLSLIGLRVEITRGTILLAGGLSGFMSTVAAIGGPPLALIYQYSAPDAIRANLAAHFSVGGVISLMMLAGIGKFGLPELTAALRLVPGTALGYALGPWASRYLDRRARPAVLLFVAASALAVLAREL